MAWYFREVNQNRWYKEKLAEWVNHGDIPADTLSDVRTTDNALSLYVVEESENLLRIVAALKASRPHGHADYILFPPEVVSQMGLPTRKTRGNTNDEQVNDWHVDVVDLSGRTLVDLSVAIVQSEHKLDRLSRKQVLGAVRDSVEQGYIHHDDLSDSYRKRLVEP